MRLKIQSVAPLPVVRVWFTPGADLLDISDLTATLAREVFAAKSKNASPLNLSLDGFELLEASLLSDVLRDGDLVVVKAADISKKTPEVGKKRKRSSSPKTTRSAPLRVAKLSSSSSSSSASSSASSSSSSSSDSESDSDSDSDSSSSASPPSTFTSHPRVLVPQTQTARRSSPHLVPTAVPTTTKKPMHVPPGKGRSSTHSRNQRRRIKRIADANAASTLPDFVSTINATPVAKQLDAEVDRRVKARIHGPAPDVASALNNAFGGNDRAGRLDPGALDAADSPSPSTLHTPLYPPTDAEETLNVQMMSMLPKSKNKNKSRRGGEEIDPRSRKIVFGTPPPPPVAEVSFNGEDEVRRSRPVLIPPSSLSHLPSNVFITCVDVEEGMKKPKKKKRRVEQTEENWAVEEPALETTVLDYGEEEIPGMVVEEPRPKPDLDASMFDFDAAPAITLHTQLTEGCIIGYMGLIMNMKNFSPEMGKRYGCVLSCTDQVVTIRLMFTEDLDEDELVEELEWKEIQGQWKLLQ
ncbi:hypothetical protein C8F04DRAFT_1125669 [Mycena alexandri]|uniref:Coilin n=1 Tax=Mycena alexandri TaxID=1745969 RepID=A0AAD6SES1_9AGAR|nr:hypothetical protein C8F04DRAFT_1125669 [Mycena alexandri]